MKTYRHEGNIWDHTPASALTSDQAVVIGTVCGIAVNDIAANETGAVRVQGVVEFACPSSDDIQQGALLNLDVAGQEFQLAAGDLAGAGVAAAPSGVGENTVYVSLNPGLV